MAPHVTTHVPDTLEDALALLAEHGDEAKLVAGGTAFTILWRAGLISAEHVVSCAHLTGLNEIDVGAEEITMGALATFRDAQTDVALRDRLPVVVSTLAHVGNLRMRNVATWGGNVAEADNTSDVPCLLSALNARVHVIRAGDERTIPIDGFFVDFFETVLEPEEFVMDVTIPALTPRYGTSYVKFVSRNAEDRTCMGVTAVLATDDDGLCTDVRVAAIGAATIPLRLPELERQLQGQRLTPEAMQDLGSGLAAAADPLTDVRGSAAFRIKVLPALVVEALTRAAARENCAVLT